MLTDRSEHTSTATRTIPGIFPDTYKNVHVHLVGIKGTGMAALAEVLVRRGVRITGSDTNEKFYTDEILGELGIDVSEGFSASNIGADTKLVVHSSAYSEKTNPDLAEAASRGVPCISYPEALGLLSERSIAAAVSGVHGKTTTTAMAGTIIKHMGLDATVIAGSRVFTFDNRSTLIAGDKFLVAETCEYKRHFLHFRPRVIVMTNVELDHPDYFKDTADIENAFVEFASSLPEHGTLIYCADDAGAVEVVSRVSASRSDIALIPYGTTADGDFQIRGICSGGEHIKFLLAGFEGEFTLKIPGMHSVYNAAAAIALAFTLARIDDGMASPQTAEETLVRAKAALLEFSGSTRRTEVLGEAAGVLFIDDYAHHPTAVLTTLKGIREFYANRRLVVDFMSHTYSRTGALLAEFGTCFAPAHTVILHRIYASARESMGAGVSGRTLFEEVAGHHDRVHYFEEPMDALEFLSGYLEPNDIFLTMGAGDNWKLGKALLARLTGERR